MILESCDPTLQAFVFGYGRCICLNVVELAFDIGDVGGYLGDAGSLLAQCIQSLIVVVEQADDHVYGFVELLVGYRSLMVVPGFSLGHEFSLLVGSFGVNFLIEARQKLVQRHGAEVCLAAGAD